jgi:hypothetical protein
LSLSNPNPASDRKKLKFREFEPGYE